MADGDPIEPVPGEPYAAGDLSANEQLLNSAIYHGLSLERVNAGMAQDIKDLLVKAQEEITGKLQSGKLTDWQTKRAQQFLEWSNKTIANAYKQIDAGVADNLDGIKLAEIAKQTNSVNQALGVEISPAMSTQQLEAIAKTDELLVNGAVMSDWWKKQAANLQHQVMTTVQQGLAQGQSTQDIADSLRDFLPTDEDISQKQAVAQANALARTAAATVQSEAQQAYYKNNQDIMKGIQWVSTLDSRTTPQCQAMDGKTYQYNQKNELVPVGHNQPFPGFPPIHWNCRSTTVPVLKSWQELSKKELPHLDNATVEEAFKQNLADQGFTPEQIDQTEMNQRASVDGTVPAATTYEDWLKDQPELTQKSILGPAKWQLWHDGQVTLADMINKNTMEPLTVDELIAAAQQNKAIPAPPIPVEGKYGLSLAENQILTAQMTSGAVAGEQWASWYNPANGVRIDQALKSSITQAENAQLQAQQQLIQLTNSLSNVKFWNKSDASLWAGQPGFQSAKLVTPSGRLITAKLKAGMTWTEKDASKYWAKLQEAREEGLDEFDAQQEAFQSAGNKIILTQTEPGALSLDSSTMKKVYGPVHPEDKPLSFLEAHANQQKILKDAELNSQMQDIKAQLKAADQAQQDYAEQAQLAREKQAQLQTTIAEQQLWAMEQEQKEAQELLAKHQAELEEAKKVAAAKKAAADFAAQQEADYIASIAKSKEIEAKIAAEKAAKAAARKAAADAADQAAQAQIAAMAQTIAAEKAAQAAAAAAAQAAADLAAKKAQQKAIKAQKAAAKKAAKAAQAAAAPVDTQGQMQLSLQPKADIKANFPADPMALKVIQRLGGSTGAELVEDLDGNKYVRKLDTNKGQVNDEYLADEVYAKMGIPTPEGKLYSTPQGPVKLTKFIDGGKMLGDYLNGASPVEKQQVMAQVRRGFVTDAWLGNWDVAGLSLDNILVDKNGTAYRIDNGGSLRFRGMGSKKTDAQFPSDSVGEINTLRNPNTAPQASKLFKDITDQEIVDQAVRLYMQKNELLAMFPADLRAKMAGRLDYLDNYATDLVAQGKAMMPVITPTAPGLPPAAPAKPPAPPKVQFTLKGFPTDPEALKAIGIYPVGNGIGEIVEDANGNKYIRRTGGNPDAMLEESRAADFLGKFGVLVPEHEMFTDAAGNPIMLQKFVEGKTVTEFMQTATDADKLKLADALGKNFALDALMGNTHVADGIRITRDKTGKMQIWRVDNSGVFRYNSTGGMKQAGAWENGQGVAEVWTMRGLPAPHAEIAPSGNTVALLQHLDIVDVAKLLRDLPPAPPTTGDAQLDAVLLKRWQNMRQIAEGALDADHFDIKTEWLEGQTAQRGNLKQIGVTDRLDAVTLKKTGHADLTDQNNRAWDDLRGVRGTGTPPPPPGTLPNDNAFQTILDAIKSVNHKYGNPSAGPPNWAKVDKAIATKPMLENWLLNGTADEKAAAAKYLPFVGELEQVKLSGLPKSITNFTQYMKTATRPVAALASGSIPAQVRAEIENQVGPKGYKLIYEWAGSQAGSSQGMLPMTMRGLWSEIRDLPAGKWYLGTDAQTLKNTVNTVLNNLGISHSEAIKVLQIWNAFMQEIFNNMKIPNVDQDLRVVKLMRYEPRDVQIETPSGGTKALMGTKAGKTVQAIKGAFDSHSFFEWVHVHGKTYTETAIPFALINGFYAVERGEPLNLTRTFFAGDHENELAADGGGIPSKVVSSSTPAISNDATTWGLGNLSYLRPDDGSLD